MDPATTGFLFGAILVSLVPGIIATMRGSRSAGAIWALSILLGWTLIGWVAAFVWAFVSKARPSAKDYRAAKQRFHLKRAAEKTCPDCAEVVRSAARVCRHCGYEWPARREAR